MIDKTSRYAKVGQFVAADVNGVPLTVLELREVPATTGFYLYTPKEGERLDHLGQRYFRDPKKFWKICDASDVLDPFDVIVPGRQVLIPPNK
jgi:hypothetical protein